MFIFILFFIAYSSSVFFVSNLWFLIACTIFNILLLIVFRVNFKKIVKSIGKIFMFTLFVFCFNIIFDSVINSLFVAWKIVIVANFAFIFSYIVKSTQLANGFSQLLFPLKLFKINTDDFVIMLVIALNFIPIVSVETKTFKNCLLARNVKLNLKTVFTKSHLLFVAYFVNLFQKVNELEMTLLTRNYGS